MKKRTILFAFALLASIMFVNAQDGFGIKAGLSYNSNGELKDATNEIGNIVDNKGGGKSGFNVGFFGKVNLGPIFLRPELVYTKTTSEYSINSQSQDYKMSKIDVPVLVGIKLLGPINVFAGPAFQYIIDNDLSGVDNLENVENEFSLGMNIGASVVLGRIGIDVRYERGLSENEANFTNASKKFTLDSRPDQIIFSLSYSLSKKKE